MATRYSTHAGRAIYKDGSPFLSLNYVVPRGHDWNPSEADEVARAMSRWLNQREARRKAREDRINAKG